MFFIKKYFIYKRIKRDIINNISQHINFILDRFYELENMENNQVIKTEITILINNFGYLQNIFQKPHFTLNDLHNIDNFLSDVIDIRMYNKYYNDVLFNSYMALIIHSVSNIMSLKKKYRNKYYEINICCCLFI